jgi:hypothetical protein
MPKKPEDFKASLEPSIWRKDYMMRFLDPAGCNPWQFEAGWCAPGITGKIVGCRHEVYPKSGVDGVYRRGVPHEPNIRRIPQEDCNALKKLGYTGIMKGELSYDTGIVSVI